MSTIISISSATILEGEVDLTSPNKYKQIVFTISLSEPLTEDITLKYSTVNASAVSSQDYTAVTNGSIPFKKGDTVQTISIIILNDNINEFTESFLVNVFIPRNTTLNPNSVDILAATGVGNIAETLTASSTTTLSSTIENLSLTGTANISGTGNSSNNVLTGNSGNNVLDGGAGNDTLDGGAGADTLNGGVGDDTYIIDNLDTIIENFNSGVDTVQAGFSYTLGNNLENLILTGADKINGTGNSANNLLTGNSGNNILNGGAGNDTLNGGTGADTLNGGEGDDTYVIDGSDVINDTTGNDTVQAAFTYTLTETSNLENLTLIGTANINGTGNSLNNRLTGNSNSNILSGGAGNDVLDGGGGIDTLIGGAGDDVYVLDNPGDFISETASNGSDTGGIDTIQSNFSYVLQSKFEHLVLIGNDHLEGVGNNLNNTITGNAGNNIIDGSTGADIMAGGLGNDTYIVENTSDVVSENANAGIDTIEASVNYTLQINVENLTLTGSATTGTGNILNNSLIGNELNNTLSGSSGNDTLDGKGGRDVLEGGTGNDTYVVDNVGDVVIETSTLATEIDLVSAEVSFILSDNVENLTLQGSANINGTGNKINNTILGNSGNNFLSSGEGNDTLTGGAGNDSLDGGAGNDSLDGGIGRDTLRGGAGDDTYVVDSYLDSVTESLSTDGVADKVKSFVTYILGSNVEKLELMGSATINGSGNNLNNEIIGNTAANTLDGGSGDDDLDGGGGPDLIIGGLGKDTLDGSTGDIDTLIGGVGDDTYFVGLPEDVIVESANEGRDMVYSGATTYTISANIEDLYLSSVSNINGTGNEMDNRITGGGGANIIDGGVGRDTMTGGLGNDVYYVDNSGDVVSEIFTATAPAELDTIVSSVSYTLSDNVEKLILTGSANLSGTGNDDKSPASNPNALVFKGNNTLIGNGGNNTLRGLSGNDFLDGGFGSDTLIGGTGNDSYVVDNAGDIVTEVPGPIEGIDLVFSSLSEYTLTANIENLSLTGAAAINGTGNSGENLMTGNSSNNILKGDVANYTLNSAGGNDILIGGMGDDVLNGQLANDILTGGAGKDRFVYNTGRSWSAADLGSDRITDFQSSEGDTIVLGKTTFGLTSAVGSSLTNTEFTSVTTDLLAKSSGARIVYSKESGNLFYNPNGTVVGAEAIFTTLASQLSLSANHFIIEA